MIDWLINYTKKKAKKKVFLVMLVKLENFYDEIFLRLDDKTWKFIEVRLMKM